MCRACPGDIEVAQLAARVCAGSMSGGIKIPDSTDDVWDAATNYACDWLNRTAKTTNRDSNSPYKTWYGEPAKLQVLPLFYPASYHRKRTKKSDPTESTACFFLVPTQNHPGERCVFLVSRRVTFSSPRKFAGGTSCRSRCVFLLLRG